MGKKDHFKISLLFNFRKKSFKYLLFDKSLKSLAFQNYSIINFANNPINTSSGIERELQFFILPRLRPRLQRPLEAPTKEVFQSGTKTTRRKQFVVDEISNLFLKKILLQLESYNCLKKKALK